MLKITTNKDITRVFMFLFLENKLVIVMISEFYLSFFIKWLKNNKKYGIIYFIIKSGRLLWQK